MTKPQLEQLASNFLNDWETYQRGDGRTFITRYEYIRQCVNLGLIRISSMYVHGEYIIQYAYTGPAFASDKGSIIFTQEGRLFAHECAKQYARRHGGGMQILQSVAHY